MPDPGLEPPILTCPLCGSEVDSYPTCHTWGGKPDGTGWMHCLPCDSATEWYCTADDCRWSWTQGLNPRNPRSVVNDQAAPEWAHRA